jgi:hypothetical protein
LYPETSKRLKLVPELKSPENCLGEKTGVDHGIEPVMNGTMSRSEPGRAGLHIIPVYAVRNLSLGYWLQ